MKKQQEITLGNLVLATYRIWNGKCPRCFSLDPYYRDCPVCDAYIIGCDKALREDVLVKYIAWLKDQK